MKFCYNCGRALDDNEKCNCMEIKMSDDMIKNIQNNSYDIYDKDRLNDFIKASMISKEKELERTIILLNELEEILKKLDTVKDVMKKINMLYGTNDITLEKVDSGELSSETVWKTKERYYEILDSLKDKISELENN